MPKYWETNFHTQKFPRSGPKAKDGEILQGLRVAQAAVTEQWPFRKKTCENHLFFIKTKKITERKYFF